MSQTLMIQGTSSDAGKTTLVAALGRLLRRQGLRVVPFKPQNMALNSAVTVDGGEIGRGQAVQAQACGLEPHSDMNPILLKPCTDTGAQVIIHGRALSNMEAAAYQDYKKHAMTAVLQSYGRLQAQYDFIVVEGAGSPAEVNLREGDVANMGFAEAVNCPVILVADIDRGGVFAQLVGTLALLSASEQQRVIGFVINRFRGDLELLKPGLTWLEQRTGKPVLGVIPYIDKLHVEAEDALTGNAGASHSQCIRVKVPVWPRISNHTDFDPLRLHPQVAFEFVGPGGSLAGADLIILPGSKSSRADLQFLRRQGWQAQIRQHLRYGGKVIGICGGLQMLGQAIHDPDGIEGEPGSEAGLGLLDFETTLQPEKCLRNVRGQLQLPGQAPVSVTGYEIHAGQSSGPALARPVIRADGRGDGCISEDGQLLASYWHGLFDSEPALQALLSWAGLSEVVPLQYRAQVEAELDRLADTVAAHLDGARLMQRVGDFVAKT